MKLRTINKGTQEHEGPKGLEISVPSGNKMTLHEQYKIGGFNYER